jgi:hypothetical protein
MFIPLFLFISLVFEVGPLKLAFEVGWPILAVFARVGLFLSLSSLASEVGPFEARSPRRSFAAELLADYRDFSAGHFQAHQPVIRIKQ